MKAQRAKTDGIIDLVKRSFPEIQAIYLFGSWDTEGEFPDSDIDIALLLPEQEMGNSFISTSALLAHKLEKLLKKEVDLLNLREVSTVFQKEVIASDRRIYCADQYFADEFEMLTISYYQKLNEERKEIVDEFLLSKRAYSI